MNDTELGRILRNMYNGASQGMQVASIHLFGIIYATYIIDHYTAREIICASGLREAYQTELNKGLNLYRLISSGNYPIHLDN